MESYSNEIDLLWALLSGRFEFFSSERELCFVTSIPRFDVPWSVILYKILEFWKFWSGVPFLGLSHFSKCVCVRSSLALLR